MTANDSLHTFRLPTELLSDKDFDDLAKSDSTLCRLMLFTEGIAVNMKRIGAGEYGIRESSNAITRLGKSVDVLPLARRAQAFDCGKITKVIFDHNPTSRTFEDIKRRSREPDSGCLWGVSFLLVERTTGRFLEFFCGTRTSRPVAKDIYPFLPIGHGPVPVTLKARRMKEGPSSWHVPVVESSSTMFEEMPQVTLVGEEVDRFLIQAR